MLLIHTGRIAFYILAAGGNEIARLLGVFMGSKVFPAFGIRLKNFKSGKEVVMYFLEF